MRLIDCSVWHDDWPFASATPPWPRVIERLAEVGTSDAVVSPLGAIFAPTPDAANAQAEALVRGDGAVKLWVAPILNPAIGDGVKSLERYASNPAVAAVKLAPTYHGYRLTDPGLTSFWSAVKQTRLPVMVQTRMEDARMQSPLLRVPSFDVLEIAAISAACPGVVLIVCGVTAGEAQALPAGRADVYLETSWLDGPDPLHELAHQKSARLMHGSHAPLFESESAAGKLRCSQLSEREKAAIASEHALAALRLVESPG